MLEKILGKGILEHVKSFKTNICVFRGFWVTIIKGDIVVYSGLYFFAIRPTNIFYKINLSDPDCEKKIRDKIYEMLSYS